MFQLTRRLIAGRRPDAGNSAVRGALLLALLWAACSRNLRSADPQNWLELQSEHFLLRTDLPPEDARKAIFDLELIRNALLAAGWRSDHPSPARIIVVALAGSSELHEFLPKGTDGASLYASFGERLILAAGDGDLLDSEEVKHEVTHALAHDLLVTEPRWMEEGLACYLETLKIDRQKGVATRGDTTWRRLDYLRWHPTDRVNWSTWIMGTGAAFNNDNGYAFETFSWVLVHWLVDKQPKRFDDFIARLSRGDNMWAAFNAIFPDLNEGRLRTELHAYLLHTSLMARSSFPVQAWNGKVELRRMPAGEAHALRAQLFALVYEGPRKERRRRIDEELELAKAADPANPLALALSGADPKPAIDAHPDDWRSWIIWYDRNPQDASAIHKAAELAPDNAEALSRVALVEQKEGRKDLALRHAEEAVKSSARSFVLDALAQIYDANDRCADAVLVEERAIDALPDAVDGSVPAMYRDRLSDMVLRCGKRDLIGDPKRRVEVEPVLRSCRQTHPILLNPRQRNETTVQFTIREDGNVTAVSVKGPVDDRVNGVIRQFVESCQFEPAIVEGKPQPVHANVELRSLL